MSVRPVLRLPISVPPGPVRIVGVVSRCANCQREFRTALDADNRIPLEALVCGDTRCRPRSPEPPAAA